MSEAMVAYEAQQWDGGERQNPVALFAREADARKVAGAQGAVVTKVVRIFDSVEEYQANRSSELRKKALAKLTAEERVALGFSADANS